MNASVDTLPLYPRLDEIAEAIARSGPLVLHAEPGAGKTTLVPGRLLAHEAFAGRKILLLQPRRIAARAAAITSGRLWPRRSAPWPPMKSTYSLPSTSHLRGPWARCT
jgi:ATP-dependent helicase HrpB